ncbi:unnamed protein product, partial [Timema podura]|nr:unnamed protein product [Timema podura]
MFRISAFNVGVQMIPTCFSSRTIQGVTLVLDWPTDDGEIEVQFPVGYTEPGISKEQALKIADQVGLKDKRDQTAEILLRLYNLFLAKDALLIEVNPYAEDSSGS